MALSAAAEAVAVTVSLAHGARARGALPSGVARARAINALAVVRASASAAACESRRAMLARMTFGAEASAVEAGTVVSATAVARKLVAMRATPARGTDTLAQLRVALAARRCARGRAGTQRAVCPLEAGGA